MTNGLEPAAAGDIPKKRKILPHASPNAGELVHTLPTYGIERWLALKWAGVLPVRGKDDAPKRVELLEQLCGVDWDLDELGTRDYPVDQHGRVFALGVTKAAMRYLRELIERCYDDGVLNGRQTLDMQALRIRVSKTLAELE